ncbi:hypothetical protein F5148DRAFT_1256737 [Russula earlei]|uniref:Uncharacterized protein n=1 Tax=Russula earlei TaxID=71964 RepID=A0ACC0TSL4_9AGAM|nr:hypothetical protein F5148DRAFT_1256737 [Russula earlei]
MSFDPLSILNLKFRGRTIAVFRNQCSRYEGVVTVAQRNFRSLQDVPVDDILLMAVIPGYPSTDEVSTIVHAVTIALESELRTSRDCDSPCSSSSPLPTPHSPSLPESNPLSALQEQSSNVTTGSQKKKKKKKKPSDVTQTVHITFPSLLRPTPDPFEVTEAGLLRKKISHLYQIIETKVGYSPPFPLDSLSVEDFMSMRVRKPIIYLYPPSSLPNVTVDLQLTPSWRFSAVYPSPQFDENQIAQHLTWTIAAEPDGTLVDKTTGTEVSYLYWEADAKLGLVTPDGSRATTPVEDIETFDPSRPSVKPGESILLPIDKVPGYLDMVLKALALHTEARTSFVTYWLPDLLKHKYIALRFLRQESYEKSARMRISPTPDVVTRVFMLFRGVASGDLGHWEEAAARATVEDGATFWARIVGVNAVQASDRGLFRVLEWGGMEVTDQ